MQQARTNQAQPLQAFRGGTRLLAGHESDVSQTKQNLNQPGQHAEQSSIDPRQICPVNLGQSRPVALKIQMANVRGKRLDVTNRICLVFQPQRFLVLG